MTMFIYGLHSPEASEASITSRCSAGLSKTAKTDLSALLFFFCSDFAAGSSNLAAIEGLQNGSNTLSSAAKGYTAVLQLAATSI